MASSPAFCQEGSPIGLGSLPESVMDLVEKNEPNLVGRDEECSDSGDVLSHCHRNRPVGNSEVATVKLLAGQD